MGDTGRRRKAHRPEKKLREAEVIAMLRIAVCDDMDNDLRRIVALTNEYLTSRSMSAELRAFSHPDALLTVCEKESHHIFLLDMVMPMVSGLELGREIRLRANHLHHHRTGLCAGRLRG
ncbi:MAG: hypothetical protein RR949_02155 [Oscillospiraceae bacterium]